jgi:hypothetical protein
MRISELIRPGCQIEVGGTYRPGYRWVQGWEVRDPRTGNWSTPMRLSEARQHARSLHPE